MKGLSRLGKYRLALMLIGLAIVVGASLPPFMVASCLTRQQTPAELRATESLRAMTRRGELPPESVVARIESDFSGTRLAALARIVRGRIKIEVKDYAGAAAVLDSKVIRDHSVIADYALILRADALEQSGQLTQARSAYQELIRDYPSSLRATEARLRLAELMIRGGQATVVPALLKDLAQKDNAAALILTAKAEQSADSGRAISAYRRIYFFAPASEESTEAASALARLGSNIAPASEEEAVKRAERLLSASRFADAFQAYSDAFAKFPTAATPQNQLRRGIAAYGARRLTEAANVFSGVPSDAGEIHIEALFYLAQTYARARQWAQARTGLEELRRGYPKSSFTSRALIAVAQIADDAKNSADASYFRRLAVTTYPGAEEVAQAQFDLAWSEHDAKNYAESSKMLTEHLALYADRNTDNRGRAGYWAARDSERAGKLSEARALYEAMQSRYDSNWYGYLARHRLEALARRVPEKAIAMDSMVGKAIANLQTVTVAEETAGPEAAASVIKADQLSTAGLDDWAVKELARALEVAPDSPRLNLATARIYRSQDDNVRALNTLKKSFPDYSQMKPEELTRAEWEVFYPLAYWEIITQESRARNLDPYQVAGLIRQETIFNPRARSAANAYGLMQVLLPTARLTAKKYGVERSITIDSLYEPRLNVQLGTAYMRDQIDKFGRIEYVAAAYNAGPLRVPQWRASLPAEIDEWVEEIPFKETRGYVQGVVRNRLQYLRLYDTEGKFRPVVGTKAVSAPPPDASPSATPPNPTVRRSRVTPNDNEE